MNTDADTQTEKETSTERHRDTLKQRYTDTQARIHPIRFCHKPVRKFTIALCLIVLAWVEI